MRFKEFISESGVANKRLKVENFFVFPKTNMSGASSESLMKKGNWYAKFYIDPSDLYSNATMLQSYAKELESNQYSKFKGQKDDMINAVESLVDLEYKLIGYVFLSTYKDDQEYKQDEFSMRVDCVSFIPVLTKNSKYYIVNQDAKLLGVSTSDIINLEEFMKGIL